MLTGKLSPTSGDAYVMGYSVKENVHNIQRLVGSVPQHDLLWGTLSAAEHIRMFAQIKGVPRSQLSQEVDNVLQKVHLSESAEQQAGGYSGGMKRRLSIALAGIGGPRVIMLDEPTTGKA
jgi:ABC-type multidrug transport system ATPase subunit